MCEVGEMAMGVRVLPGCMRGEVHVCVMHIVSSREGRTLSMHAMHGNDRDQSLLAFAKRGGWA